MFDKLKKIINDNSTSQLKNLYFKFNEHYKKREYPEALIYAIKLRDLTFKVFGKNHKEYARTLNNIANIHNLMEHPHEAFPLYEEAGSIIKYTIGTHNRDYSLILHGLANTYHKIGRYNEALLLYEEARGIIKDTMGSHNQEYSMILNGLASTYQKLGQYEQASILYNESINLKLSLFGRNNQYAIGIFNLGTVYLDMGKYEEALPLLTEAKAIIKDSNGIYNQEYIKILNELANLYQSSGRYEEALNFYNESKDIITQLYPKNNISNILILQKIANLHYTLGKYDSSLTLYQEVAEIIKSSNGQKNIDHALSLHNIAFFYQVIGRYEEALSLFIESKSMAEAIETDTFEYAAILNGLANLYQDLGRYTEALTLYNQARAIYEKIGINNLEYSHLLNDLASLYYKIGRFEEALPLYKQAKDLRLSLNGKSYHYAESLSNIALLYQATGEFKLSLDYYMEAKELFDNVMGDENPKYAKLLNNLAILLIQLEKYIEAFQLLKKVFLIDIKTISEIFSISNEKQRSKFLENLNFSLDGFLSLISGPLKNNKDAVRFAAEVVLSWKGLELETSLAENEIYLANQHPEFTNKFQELHSLRDQHVQLVIAGYSKLNSDQYKKINQDLENKIKTLETDLARNIPEMDLKKRIEKINLEVIGNHLPTGSVLVEFIKFNLIQEDQPSQWRYIAFTLKSEDPGNVEMIDLGKAESIDDEIIRLRQETTGENSRGINEDNAKIIPIKTYSKIDNIILGPILKKIGDCDHIIISPDGDLHLFPFEIIPYQNRYLMDKFEINYLATGRDLLKFDQTPGVCYNPIIMFDPDFDYNNEYLHSQTDSGRKNQISNDFNDDKKDFDSLPGSRLEGERISKILEDTKPLILEGTKAVETHLKKLKSPWILHLATHGFFLKNQQKTTTNTEEREYGLRFTGPGMENPLIRSGLAFAGANNWENLPADAEDGILTAKEATGLNLLNTELVVLSACETGLGELKRFEGVFGLRRAFVLAGAHTLIMSLWKVDDLATSILMEQFYQNLIIEKMGRNESLKKAQIYLREVKIGKLKESWLSEKAINNSPKELRRNLRRLSNKSDEFQQFKHPLFWGAFICQGDPRPLQNKSSYSS